MKNFAVILDDNEIIVTPRLVFRTEAIPEKLRAFCAAYWEIAFISPGGAAKFSHPVLPLGEQIGLESPLKIVETVQQYCYLDLGITCTFQDAPHAITVEKRTDISQKLPIEIQAGRIICEACSQKREKRESFNTVHRRSAPLLPVTIIYNPISTNLIFNFQSPDEDTMRLGVMYWTFQTPPIVGRDPIFTYNCKEIARVLEYNVNPVEITKMAEKTCSLQINGDCYQCGSFSQKVINRSKLQFILRHGLASNIYGDILCSKCWSTRFQKIFSSY